MYRYMYISMANVTFTDLRNNLASHLDKVEQDHVELVVTRQNHAPVVIVSMADWQSMQETNYLLGNTANAKRLLQSVAELDKGQGADRALIDP